MLFDKKSMLKTRRDGMKEQDKGHDGKAMTETTTVL